MPRIPGLPNFTGAAASEDELALWDSSADRTFGATLEDLAEYFVAYIDLPGDGSGFVAPPNDGAFYAWLNTDWAVAPIQADAASDGTIYGRQNAGWAAAPIQADAASNGSYYARRNGAWEVVPGAGLSDAASDGNYYARRNADWAAVPTRASVSTVSGSTHIPAVATDGQYYRCTGTSGCAVTIPANADEAFPVGTMLTYEQVDDDPITFVGDTGVTLNVPASRSAETAEQYAVVQVCKVATNEWVIYGNLAAA